MIGPASIPVLSAHSAEKAMTYRPVWRILLKPSGQDCLRQACRSRRVCPVGRDYQYEPAQARFHIGYFFLKHRTVAVRSNHVK